MLFYHGKNDFDNGKRSSLEAMDKSFMTITTGGHLRDVPGSGPAANYPQLLWTPHTEECGRSRTNATLT